MKRSTHTKRAAARDTAASIASTQPAETGRNVEARRAPDVTSSSQPVVTQQVTPTTDSKEDGLLQHADTLAGDAMPTGESTEPNDLSVTARASDESTWGDIAAFIAEAAAAEAARPLQQPVLKQSPKKSIRRNAPLTRSEEDQVLLLVMQGFSLRQAATAIGCHNSTISKRAQRDEDFADAIARARQKARTDPLNAVREASKRSWRAAAWLVNYLDRRDNRGRRSEKENNRPASRERKLPG